MMTATLFDATRPLVAVLLCTQEGVLQWAIVCFYVWTTGTCYWDTVLRMATPVIEQMSRDSRMRFGIKRNK